MRGNGGKREVMFSCASSEERVPANHPLPNEFASASKARNSGAWERTRRKPPDWPPVPKSRGRST
jgi:hypothetical protein